MTELEEILAYHERWLKCLPDGKRADLSGRDLRGVELHWADLREANLIRADLRGANLRGTDLSWATMDGAWLEGADLDGATLTGASLVGADLEGASVRRATLREADLTSANVAGANLSGTCLASADLTTIKEDFFRVLSSVPAEVPGLYDAVVRGKIDGSAYSGECACLVGTLAKLRGEDYRLLAPDPCRPIEVWFLALSPGHTPDTSQVAAITAAWLGEFMGRTA